MAEFYDHPVTGKLHFKAAAGGFGGGATSVYDGPATAADIAAFPGDHGRYLAAKRDAAAAPSEVLARESPVERAINAEKTAIAEVEALTEKSNA